MVCPCAQNSVLAITNSFGVFSEFNINGETVHLASFRMVFLIGKINGLLFDWKYFSILATLLVLCETVLGIAIITRVRFTEIDWRAYMQEVEGWAVRSDSPTNYMTLKGNTGPLVYPAGFLYIYRGLRWIASLSERGGGTAEACASVATAAAWAPPPEPCGGLDIWTAQWVFLAIYLITLGFALDIYATVRPGSPWLCILLVLSKRIHSLFLLRLFNDCVTTMLFLAAMSFLLRRRFLLGTLLLSASVSVKMNALLALPGLGLLLLRNVGITRTTVYLLAGVGLQVALAAPFLATYPQEYLAKAFEFSRVFFYQWTVNWKFVPEPIFLSPTFAYTLLVLHFSSLLLFVHTKWTRHDGGLLSVLGQIVSHEWRSLGRFTGAFHDSPRLMAELLWGCVFIGIVFSRTIHFQFYVWYFHSLPFLLASLQTKPSWLRTLLRLGLFAGIEYGYTVVNSSLGPEGKPLGEPLPLSALVLQCSHVLLLVGSYFGA